VCCENVNDRPFISDPKAKWLELEISETFKAQSKDYNASVHLQTSEAFIRDPRPEPSLHLADDRNSADFVPVNSQAHFYFGLQSTPIDHLYFQHGTDGEQKGTICQNRKHSYSISGFSLVYEAEPLVSS
jgi:hypothetical protein